MVACIQLAKTALWLALYLLHWSVQVIDEFLKQTLAVGASVLNYVSGTLSLQFNHSIQGGYDVS